MNEGKSATINHTTPKTIKLNRLFFEKTRAITIKINPTNPSMIDWDKSFICGRTDKLNGKSILPIYEKIAGI